MKYSKVRFVSKFNGTTAGIVLSQKQLEDLTISQISKMFPLSEAMKMERLERGEYYDSFEDAFNHTFDTII